MLTHSEYWSINNQRAKSRDEMSFVNLTNKLISLSKSTWVTEWLSELASLLNLMDEVIHEVKRCVIFPNLERALSDFPLFCLRDLARQWKLSFHFVFLSPVYTSNFYVTSFIYLPVYTSNFYLKTKDWRLETTDDIKKISNFMCCRRLHGQFSVCDNFYLPHKN